MPPPFLAAAFGLPAQGLLPIITLYPAKNRRRAASELAALFLFSRRRPEKSAMAESVQLKTQPRGDFGTANARRLRKKGLMPAVIYGHKQEVLSVVLPRDEFEKAVRKGVHVVDLQHDGKTETARIRELQWDHLGKTVLHADFMRVDKDERIVIGVPVHLRGHAPGIADGGVLDQPIHVLNVECPVLEIPEHIRVNVDKLKIGDAIHVKELTLPPNVVAKTDPEAVVVIVKAQKVEEAAPAAAVPVEGAAEPEVIKKPPKAEETEE
jgi:large subunit ribosomal protein L25